MERLRCGSLHTYTPFRRFVRSLARFLLSLAFPFFRLWDQTTRKIFPFLRSYVLHSLHPPSFAASPLRGRLSYSAPAADRPENARSHTLPLVLANATTHGGVLSTLLLAWKDDPMAGNGLMPESEMRSAAPVFPPFSPPHFALKHVRKACARRQSAPRFADGKWQKIFSFPRKA